MIRSKDILHAVVIAVTVLVSPIAATSATAQCDPSAFLAKASWLPATFNPQANGAHYNPPQGSSAIDPASIVGKDLATAFCLASPTIQNQFMRLDGIFVLTQDTCPS